jgi:hypothetical protein
MDMPLWSIAPGVTAYIMKPGDSRADLVPTPPPGRCATVATFLTALSADER